MNEGEFGGATANAVAAINDEMSRSHHVSDPGAARPLLLLPHLASLKRRHEFLNEYSDEILSTTPIDTLLKLESTSIKLRNLERGEGTDDKLAANRDSLDTTITTVAAGEDNRWTKLHPSRFLPGAACSAVKLWLRAREVLENSKTVPVAVYDMASIGLAGYVTPKGWEVIHDPGSSLIQLRLFSINNCGKRVGSKANEYGEDELNEVSEMGELKLAIRVLREAMNFVHPWNKSIAALEGFLMQSRFCYSDLEGIEKPATILCQFIDYCLRENSNRWRGQEAFLTTTELKSTWGSFYGSRPQSVLAKAKKAGQKNSTTRPTYNNNSSHSSSHNSGYNTSTSFNQQSTTAALFHDDICVMWNWGKCVKPPGACATRKGRALRHVCNFRTDPNNPAVYCGANHPANTSH